MSSWRNVPLGDVVQFSSGGTPSRKTPEYFQGDIPWITGADIDASGAVVARARITSEAVRESATTIVPAGTVLLVTRTSVGKVGEAAFDVAFSQDVTALRPIDDRLRADYLRHFLRARQSVLSSQARGATIKGVTREVVEGLEIPLPPLQEQRRIAVILDQANALRAKRREAIAQMGAISRSLFFEMFGNPVTNPRRWAVRSLGDVVDNQDALRVPLKSADRDLLDEIYPYFGASGIIDYVDDFLFDGYRLLVGEDGANLVTRSSPIAFMASGRFWVNNHAHVLGASGVAELRYVQEVIEATDLTPYVSGSAQPKLNQANLNRIPIPVPPIEMQQAFVARVGQATVVRAQGVEQLGRLDHLFLSLEDRAFKGEL